MLAEVRRADPLKPKMEQVQRALLLHRSPTSTHLWYLQDSYLSSRSARQRGDQPGSRAGRWAPPPAAHLCRRNFLGLDMKGAGQRGA